MVVAGGIEKFLEDGRETAGACELAAATFFCGGTAVLAEEVEKAGTAGELLPAVEGM